MNYGIEAAFGEPQPWQFLAEAETREEGLARFNEASAVARMKRQENLRPAP